MALPSSCSPLDLEHEGGVVRNWNYEARECAICHRVGYRSFVPYGSEGWRCLHETSCSRRASQREYLPAGGGEVSQQSD